MLTYEYFWDISKMISIIIAKGNFSIVNYKSYHSILSTLIIIIVIKVFLFEVN